MKTFLLALLLPAFAMAAERVALIIGNGEYLHGSRLANPVNDANAFADKLKATGFEVELLHDGTAKDMARGINRFAASAKGADFALFYYAGHGMEIATEGAVSKNYLLPVDAQLEAAGDEKVEAMALQSVLDEMKNSGARLKVVILDCCRNNPFSGRSWLRSRGGGGLAEVSEKDLPEGTMIVFSGAPGKTVPDGSGSNSPFTTALLQDWRGGMSVPAIVSAVVEKVSASEPWIRFDGSGRTFAAFQSYRLGGGSGSTSDISIPSAPMPTVPAAPPAPKPPAADVKLIASYDASSQLRAMTTRSEGTINYHPRYAFDGDKTTSWLEGVEGTGAGEWVSADFSRTVTLTAVSILPGYGKNADIFRKNGRVKKLEMILDGEHSFKLNFEDAAQYHRFSLPSPMTVRTVKFRILEALRGTKYEETAISDILFE